MQNLTYTLCFVCHADRVLMLERRYPPKAGFLNGVGGKRRPGESPRDCIIREVREETGIPLADPRFGGIVTWTGFTHGADGMYVFLDHLPPVCDPAQFPCDMAEGRLSWVPVSAVLSGQCNPVENISHFLPPMLAGDAPAHYAFIYDGEEMQSHTIYPLPPDMER